MVEIIKGDQKKQTQNYMSMEFGAVSANESLARIAVTGFVTPLNPTLEELSDIKTAVSEAVTNAIVHGYEDRDGGNCIVRLTCYLRGDILEVSVKDWGVGMEDVERAMEPLYTTKPDAERSGMGFAFMEAFMDDLQVKSEPGKGTTVTMVKKLGTESWLYSED